MSIGEDLLTQTLRDPRSIERRTPSEWDLLLPQARAAALTARLHVLAEDQGALERIPREIRWHLHAARVEAERHALAVRWEVGRVEAALREPGIPVVLLKGAAYLMAGLSAARGRVFGDVDILVPRAALDQTERLLNLHGWLGTHADPYDQRYYRVWMHELPPLRHGTRQSTLDVHHTILPPTAKLRPDPRKLLAAARPLAGREELYVLAPEDMVLHSAAHLFHDGEFDHGLRDLVDLDALLTEFAVQPDFWRRLTDRAEEMDLVKPLRYGLRYVRKRLGTPVPDDACARLAGARRSFPPPRLMDPVFLRALAPDHPSCRDGWTALARWVLYLRAHHLRMPLHLLVPHLLRKAVRQRRET